MSRRNAGFGGLRRNMRGSIGRGSTAVAAPTLTSINTAYGMWDGGSARTLTGTGFTGADGGGANGVTFNGVAATSVVVVNDTSITCVTPAASSESVDVCNIVVTTPGGTSTLTNGYTYLSIQYAARQISAQCTVHDVKFATLNGSDVSGIDDRGDTDFDVAQGTAALQPAYSATGGPNSQPMLSTTGGEYLTKTSATGKAAGTPIWVFALFSSNAATGSATSYAITDSNTSVANATRISFGGASHTVSARVHDGTSAVSDDPAAMSLSTFAFVDGYITTTSGNQWTAAKNGTASGSPSALAAGTQGKNLIAASIGAGPTGLLPREISLCIAGAIYGEPTTAAFLTMERYLEERFALTIGTRTN